MIMVFEERKKVVTVLKQGYVDFYMNGDFIKSRKYHSVTRRKELLGEWKKEIRRIMDVNQFHYVIKPKL